MPIGTEITKDIGSREEEGLRRAQIEHGKQCAAWKKEKEKIEKERVENHSYGEMQKKSIFQRDQPMETKRARQKDEVHRGHE
eukprot:4780207-Amphidinium_carterae.1